MYSKRSEDRYEIAAFIACLIMIAIFVFAVFIVPARAFAQAQTMDQGCFLSFETGECQEPSEFIWIDFGRDANKHTYGAPVAGLLNQAVRDRRQLLKWIRYSEKLEGKVRKLRGRK